MTNDQILHLNELIKQVRMNMMEKYRKGANEHGGNLWDLSPIQLLTNAIDEATDQLCYLITMHQKLTGYNFGDPSQEYGHGKGKTATEVRMFEQEELVVGKAKCLEEAYDQNITAGLWEKEAVEDRIASRRRWVENGLTCLFSDHAELSDLILEKNGVKVKLDELRGAALLGQNGPNDLPSIWLRRFVRAITDEVRELNESIAWKWWRTDKTDMENVRVELIDILHFVISACIASGMTGADVAEVYYRKRELNFKRQKSGFVPGDNEAHGVGKL